MIYVYALIGSSGDVPAHMHGIDQAEVWGVSAGDLVAVVSALTGETPTPTFERLWQHERVVERLMQDETPLPVRYGTCFQSQAALQYMLTSNHEHWCAALQHVRGCVEVGIRVLRTGTAGHGQPVSDGHTDSDHRSAGYAYMMARFRERQQQHAIRRQNEQLARHLDTALTGLVNDRVLMVSADTQQPFKAAYLLPRAHVLTMQETVHRYTKAWPDLQVVCTGPWPPYHFIERMPVREETSKSYASRPA